MSTPHDYLEKHERKLVRSLQEMVRVPTVNPPGERYREMVDLLQGRCRELGMKGKVYRVPDERVEKVVGSTDFPRYNLVARWDVGAKKTVHFNGHFDVVPAAGKWRYGDPFRPEVNHGMLYGRGSGDMKGSIAALLMAVEALQQSGCEPAVNVECSFTADEETGGELGAGYVVREGLVDADYAVVCEGAAGLQLGCGHNGVLWLEVEIQGKPAHASRPEDGINAFERMVTLVHQLQKFKGALAVPSRRFRDFNGQRRSPTINIGGVFGGGRGDKINTVPARAAFSIDRRIVPGETLRGAERELRQEIEKVARAQGIACKIRSLLGISPCVVEPSQPLPRAFAGAVQAVRRGPAGFRVTTGFTDLHYFVEEGGLPGVGYGVKGEQAHGVDERLRVHDLVQTARTYAEFMLRGVEEED
jgi:succinyl-diaminopimelate desuccinylase